MLYLQRINDNTTMNEGQIWTTELLNLFGLWLIDRGEIGYGLLSIHGSTLGIKIGDMLDIRWGDFIGDDGECTDLLTFETKKVNKNSFDYRELSEYVREITSEVFSTLPTKDTPYNYVYTKKNSEQNLSTSTLNRELQGFQKICIVEIFQLVGQRLELKPLKTNAFEIAWARDLVLSYKLSKKAFIEVSKFMGHRTVKETVSLLELEPNDDIQFVFNYYNPSEANRKNLLKLFKDAKHLKYFLLNRNLIGFFN